MQREMSGPAPSPGGFWSAIDAETSGDEGAFYVWRQAELEAVLGEEDAQFLGPLYGFDGGPFFEGGRYVLHLRETYAAAAERRRVSVGELHDQVEPLRQRLFAARAERPRPATDDKVLAEWNGMAIAGLATAGDLLGERWMIDRAASAADFVLSAMRPGGGPLLHSWRGGEAKIPAFLGDYAYLLRGLLALRRATDDARWLDSARDLFAELEDRLGDARGGWFTAAPSADVLFRSKDIFDGATPAASAVAVLAAVELAELTGEQLYLDSAARALASAGALIEHQVEAARTMTVAARRLRRLAGDRLPAAVKPPPQDDPLAREALAVLHPHFEVSEPDSDGWCVFSLAVEIADGFHLHADLGTAEGMIATRLSGDGVELRRLRAPAGRPLVMGGEVIQALRGTVEFRGELRETSATPRLLLRYQACDERRCLPAVTVGLMLAHPE